MRLAEIGGLPNSIGLLRRTDGKRATGGKIEVPTLHYSRKCIAFSINTGPEVAQLLMLPAVKYHVFNKAFVRCFAPETSCVVEIECESCHNVGCDCLSARCWP